MQEARGSKRRKIRYPVSFPFNVIRIFPRASHSRRASRRKPDAHFCTSGLRLDARRARRVDAALCGEIEYAENCPWRSARVKKEHRQWDVISQTPPAERTG